MNSLFRRPTVFCVIVLMIFTAGCASPKASRFYALNSMEGRDVGQTLDLEVKGKVVSIGHVSIPSILDRPQLVAYSGNNEVELSEFDRWAGNLKDDISRVLIDDLSVLISDEGISVVSWRHPVSTDYRIDINIIRFGSVSDREVVLSARWTVLEGKDNRVIHIHESSLRELTDGAGQAEAVAAMSRAVGKLSRELAVFIRDNEGMQ